MTVDGSEDDLTVRLADVGRGGRDLGRVSRATLVEDVCDRFCDEEGHVAIV